MHIATLLAIPLALDGESVTSNNTALAVLSAVSRSAISPKKSPAPSSRISRSSWWTFAVPLLITKKR